MEGDADFSDLRLACLAGNREKASELLEDESVAINSRGDNKETALHVACRFASGDDWIVKKLLEKGADPFLPDVEGKFPFHIACELGYSDIVGAILDRCTRKQQKENLLKATDNDGVSSLTTSRVYAVTTALHEESGLLIRDELFLLAM